MKGGGAGGAGALTGSPASGAASAAGAEGKVIVGCSSPAGFPAGAGGRLGAPSRLPTRSMAWLWARVGPASKVINACRRREWALQENIGIRVYAVRLSLEDMFTAKVSGGCILAARVPAAGRHHIWSAKCV